MEDEARGKIINESVRLKSERYSLAKVNDEQIKKAKCVNKNVVKSIRHKEYVNVLFNRSLIRHKTKSIQSKLHKFGTYDI